MIGLFINLSAHRSQLSSSIDTKHQGAIVTLVVLTDDASEEWVIFIQVASAAVIARWVASIFLYWSRMRHQRVILRARARPRLGLLLFIHVFFCLTKLLVGKIYVRILMIFFFGFIVVEEGFESGGLWSVGVDLSWRWSLIWLELLDLFSSCC